MNDKMIINKLIDVLFQPIGTEYWYLRCLKFCKKKKISFLKIK